MAQIKKAAVSGKTVKTTTYNILNPFKKTVKMVNERTTRKPAPKKPAEPRTPSKGVKKPAPKIEGAKPGVKKPMPKTLTGPAAVAELQRQVSPRGVKKAEAGAKKAIDKKYPGLYKKSK